ncbi:phage tail protein [Schauerella aestuarii]|uniref:phage tail protein n=1 Tax=Schauerella aestuarii TaxID=2511204 RepID=UPI001370AFCB|nr:phage tail protein [Achromobacter aestuarii]MYZ44216.1 phage tail protein [Achromobacter aestuarii]
MTVRLPNGAIVSIASTYGVAVPVTGISNANPAVVSAPTHGFADGAIVEVNSGWSSLAGRIGRVADADAGTFELDGVNTTSVIRYPAGGGAGTARSVSGWTQISQVLESASSGGEQQFYNYSFLEDTGDERQIPTIRSAMQMTLTIADDDTLAHYPVLTQANDDRTPRAVRFQLPSGSIILFNAYVSMSKMPSTTKNEAMALTVTLSMTGEPTRYSAEGA